MYIMSVVPQSSRCVPAEERSGILLNDENLQTELDRTTDTVANYLLGGIQYVPVLDIVVPVSSLVCDVTKQENIMTESMEVIGRGAVPYNCSQGKLREYSEIDRERILNTYYRPWHQQLAEAIDESIRLQGNAVLVEVRTFNNYSISSISKEIGSSICIGVNDTSHNKMTQAFKKAAKGSFSVSVNTPFGGCTVPPGYAKKPELNAVMIAVNQKSTWAELECIREVINKALKDILGQSGLLG